MTSGTGPASTADRSLGTVQTRSNERLAEGTGLLATLVIGAAVLIESWTGGSGVDLPLAWWAGYIIFLLAFIADSTLLSLPPRFLRSGVLSLVEVAAALATWFAAPQANWSAVLFVVSAASVAFTHPRVVTVSVIAVQTLAVAIGAAMLGFTTTDVVVSTVLCATLQAFAALVVLSARQEVESGAALGAAHADLRAASTLLAASSRDAERLRISRDLHDVVGHQLTALALELEVASHRVTVGDAENVIRARGIAKDLLRDVRATVSDLRAEVHGLESALRQTVVGIPGLHVSLTVEERVPVDHADALVLIRCVQELVTNTVRHAGAEHLTVRVVVDNAGISLMARDNGRGTRQLELGNGLTGMTERVEHRGGVITFDLGAGRGFGVSAQIPQS